MGLRFYLATSPDVRERVAAAVREAGHGVVSPPAAVNDASAASTLPTLLHFDAVVFDHNVSKFRYVEMGFWRGRGVPVVFLAGPTRSNRDDATKYAARLGMYPVTTVAHFRAWLLAEPPYLMATALDENGEFQERCRPCGGGLRAHWNGTENVCPKCGEYTTVDGGMVTRAARAGTKNGGLS